MRSFLTEKERCERTQLQTEEGWWTLCSWKIANDGHEDNSCTENSMFGDLKEQMTNIHVSLSFIVTVSVYMTITHLGNH